MNIRTVFSTLTNTAAAFDDIHGQLNDMTPDLLLIAFNTDHDGDALRTLFADHYACPFMGSSSCQGALALTAEQIQAKAQLSVLAIEDPQGHYGVGACAQSETPADDAQSALNQALKASAREYESPSLIWCLQAPGNEEHILSGFENVVGWHVPVLGGSSADNDVSGQWQAFDRFQAGDNLITVAVFFPNHDVAIGTSFSSGYEPSGKTTTVSKAEHRTVMELDNKPAAIRYNELADHCINDQVEGGNVLALTTLHPLGQKINLDEDLDDFLLSHPDAVTEQSALSLFANATPGQELHIMSGSIESLVHRGARVLETAIHLLPEGKQPIGAIMIYCAGCMLTVGDAIEAMATEVNNTAPIPILGFYTFGEQGCFLDGHNRHGNLMISAVVFAQ